MKSLTCRTEENKRYFLEVSNFRKNIVFFSFVVHVLKTVEITYWKFKKNSSTFNFKHSFPRIFQLHKKFKYNSSSSRNSSIRPHRKETFLKFLQGFPRIFPGFSRVSKGRWPPWLKEFQSSKYLLSHALNLFHFPGLFMYPSGSKERDQPHEMD